VAQNSQRLLALLYCSASCSLSLSLYKLLLQAYDIAHEPAFTTPLPSQLVIYLPDRGSTVIVNLHLVRGVSAYYATHVLRVIPILPVSPLIYPQGPL